MSATLPVPTEPLEPLESRDPRLPAWISETPYWLIAVAAHLIALLVFGTIVVLETGPEEAGRHTTIQQVFEKDPYDARLPRDVRKRPDVLTKPTELEIERPSVERVERDTSPVADEKTPQLAVTGVFGGPEAQTGGELGDRVANRIGTSGPSEDAVRAALEWLRRHQRPDGHWSSSAFHDSCDRELHGETCGFPEGVTGFGANDAGFEGFDVGVTALALLAFLGHGHTHRHSDIAEYRDVVRRAGDWLMTQQVKSDDPDLDGLYGAPSATNEEWVYNHAIATMAMAELLLMGRDRLRHRKSVDAATRWCLRAQNPGFGWKYGIRTGSNDTSVTGWMVLALKTSRACARLRLLNLRPEDFETSFRDALAWFDAATSASSGITGYQTPGDEGSRLTKAYPDAYPYSKDLSCMTAVAVLCRIFAGTSPRDERIRRGVAHLRGETPEWRPPTGKRRSPINLYSWYYATYALYQVGGRAWDDWNSAMLDTLIPHQRVGDCADGSWDPIGEWGIAGGRVYATAIGAMTLEVYYRFARE